MLWRRLGERWWQLAPVTRRLMMTRFWRSISQGMLVVDLALFLHAVGWSGASIGFVLSAAGLTGAGLSLLVGLTSDRMGRKPFLLVYEFVSGCCSTVAAWTSNPVLLSVAIVLAGFGRGANGAAGPFSPVEQAWLAEGVAPEDRGAVYSLNTAIGFFGMALGALLAVLPAFLVPWLGRADSFRPLFLLVLFCIAMNLILLVGTPESSLPRSSKTGRTGEEAMARRLENRFLWRLVALNVFNGLAIGLTGPLIAYWFAKKFLVGPSSIGPVLAGTFVVTGIAALVVGRMTRRVGLVRSVVWSRSGGLVLLLLLPMVPFYWLASLLYILRSAFNRGTVGARQALVISSVRDDRRGFAASLNALSMQLPQSLGPALAGGIIASGRFATPFYLAAILQGIYLFLYCRVFSRLEQEPGG